MRRWLAIVVPVIGVSLSQGVMGAESDTQQWTSVSLEHAVTPEVTANFKTRLSFDEDISRANSLLLQPWFSVKATDRLSVGLGYGHIAPISSSTNSEERIWQQLGFKFDKFDLPFSGRFRLEERFLEDVDTVIVRTRWRLELEIPIPIEDWYFTSSSEVFVNLNSDSGGPQSGFDQNRLYFGLGKNLFDRVEADFGYQWAYHRKRGENKNIHALVLNFKIQTGGNGKY